MKHLALVEVGYSSVPFGRPAGLAHPWFSDDAEDDVDMWATAEESREDVVAGYRRAWAQADVVITDLPVDAGGRAPWWGPDGGTAVTLHRVLVHVIGDTHRQAGHADIVRELVDGSVGNQSAGEDAPERDEAWGQGYRGPVERAARSAAGA